MAKRKRRRTIYVATGALVLVALAIATYLLTIRFTRRMANPRDPSVSAPMLRVEDGLVVIDDYNAWFEVLPRAIRRALRDGRRDPEAILVDVFSSVMPEQQWPPPSGSPQRWQWQQMVERVAQLLEPEPRPRGRVDLRVVSPSANA
jgi:hypothetical protein